MILIERERERKLEEYEGGKKWREKRTKQSWETTLRGVPQGAVRGATENRKGVGS